MRLFITLETEKVVNIPVNYQEYLTAAVYGYVGSGDEDYAKFVHDEGYVGDGGRRFKPFTHSWLRIPSRNRRIVGDRLQILPGQIGWMVSSPLDDFLRPFASGLLKAGRLRVGSETLPVAAVEAASSVEATEKMVCTCLSPIVATKRRPDGSTQFLRPSEDPKAFSEIIRSNMIAKYKAFNLSPSDDDRLVIEFDANYLAANRDGTKKASYKGIDVIGILAPFKATGSKELISLGLSAGFGSKTACGFGCVEARD